MSGMGRGRERDSVSAVAPLPLHIKAGGEIAFPGRKPLWEKIKDGSGDPDIHG